MKKTYRRYWAPVVAALAFSMPAVASVKVTLPLLYALTHADDEDAAPMRSLIERGDLTTEEINRLIEFAKREGGVDYAFDVMRKMQQEANTIIDRYPDSESKEAFKEIFEFIISRDK